MVSGTGFREQGSGPAEGGGRERKSVRGRVAGLFMNAASSIWSTPGQSIATTYQKLTLEVGSWYKVDFRAKYLAQS